MTRSHRLYTLLASTAAALALAACGGSGGSDFHSLSGTLVEPASTVAELSRAQINAITLDSGLAQLAGAALCDVQVLAINYHTPGARAGELSNASGALLLPTGEDNAACTQPAPLVAYAKGTDVDRQHTLADPRDSQTLLLAAMFAAQGYAVVATDYLGFARSEYSFHPYLHAQSEASSVLDSVRAAQHVAGDRLSGELMFTGYSQGGHSSMAAQRAAEQGDGGIFTVVAGAHLAGPYDLGGALRGPVVLGSQIFVPYMATAWQKIYGNIYQDPTEVFRDPYASYIENLLPSNNPAELAQKLPMDPRLTPDEALETVVRPQYLQDVRTNDANSFYRNALANSFLGWTPMAPVLLCGGAADPTVPPAMHRDVLMQDFAARGVTNARAVDVDAEIQRAFGPGGQAPTDPSTPEFATYYASYHGSYEPPFCLAYARDFFERAR